MTKTPDEIKNGIDWGEVDKALQNVRLDNDDNADVQKPKTPEQIKKGLECCSEDECFGERENCPYKGESGLCVGEMCVDALALIQQLQHNNAQLAIDKAKLAAENAEKDVRIQHLESELDAMKDEIDRDCETCKHCESCQEDGYCMWCENKESNKTPCCNCVYGCNWEWRGVQKEE